MSADSLVAIWCGVVSLVSYAAGAFLTKTRDKARFVYLEKQREGYRDRVEALQAEVNGYQEEIRQGADAAKAKQKYFDVIADNARTLQANANAYKEAQAAITRHIEENAALRRIIADRFPEELDYGVTVNIPLIQLAGRLLAGWRMRDEFIPTPPEKEKRA